MQKRQSRSLAGADKGSHDSFELKLLLKAEGNPKPKPVYGRSNQKIGLTAEEESVDAKYKIYSWDNQFKSSKLDVKVLNTMFMQENSEFQECLYLINEYNKEIEESKSGKLFKAGPWKMRFYTTLFNLMREVVNTKDRVIQRSFMKEVNDWAQLQLKSLSCGEKQIKPFDNDFAFMLKTINGETKDFSKFRKHSTERQRISKSIDKQGQSIIYTNYHDESRNFLDETTRDQTALDIHAPNFEHEEANTSTSQLKITSFLKQAGISSQVQPSEQIKEELKDYKDIFRTQHPEYQPPSMRLKEYKRRVVSFDDPLKLAKVIKANEQGEESFFARVTYPKPFSFQEMKKKEEEANLVLPSITQANLSIPAISVPAQEEGGKNEGDNAQKPLGDGQPISDINIAQEKQDADDKSEKEDLDISGIVIEPEPGQQAKPPLQPIIKNYLNDEYGKETFIKDLNKKFDLRSTYIAYEPSDDIREAQMEYKWVEGRQRELKEKRENEEMIKLVQEWAISKGRIEKEINRKIDSNIYGSRFKSCEYRYKKKTAEELRVLDKTTKEAGLKYNALQDIEEEENKKKRIQIKLKERAERRQERREKQNKKKKFKGGYDSDSDKEGKKDNQSDEDSYDEELDGTFDVNNPMFKNKKRFQNLLIASQKPETKDLDLSLTLPRIAKTQLRSSSNPFRGIEYEASRQKIEAIKRLHGNFINVQSSNSTEMDGERIESAQEIAQPSLSVYSRDVAQKLRPFSAIFSQVDIAILQNEQLLEVREVKNRMAKYKLSVPYKKLRDALIVPEGLTDQTDLEQLPDPGQGLIQNPFMKDKKKKKKKKKK